MVRCRASASASRAEGYIARALEQGATVAYGGKRPEAFDQGYFVESTLLADVTGFKQSGYWRSSGIEDLFDLTRIKTMIDYTAL